MKNRFLHIIQILLLLVVCNFSYAQILRPAKTIEPKKEAVKKALKDTIPNGSSNYQLSLDKIDCVVKRSSDSSKMVPATNVVYMYGNAKIEYCDMILEADHIHYNTKTKIAEAFGKRDSLGTVMEYATFKNGVETVQYDHFTFNFVTQKGIVHQLATKQGEGVIRAEKVKKISDDESFAEDMIYTTCNLEHPHYYFRLKQAKYKTDKYAAGRHVNLFIKDIPTPLYLPFAIFPREQGKRAGFTRISPGYDQTRGFSLRNLGWYQPINDNMDAELTSNFYTTGSWDMHAKFNYRKLYKNTQYLNFNYSKLNNTQVSNALGGNLTNSFQLDYSYRQDPKVWPMADFGATVNVGTSNFRNVNPLVTQANQFNNTYTSSINYTQRFRRLPFQFSSGLRYNQNTQTNAVSLSLPSLNLSTDTFFPFRGVTKSNRNPLNTINFRVTSTYNNRLNTVDSIFFENPFNAIDDVRYGVKHTIPVGANIKVFKYFNISPSLTYNEVWAPKIEQQRWDALNKTIIRDTVSQFTAARWYSTSFGLNTTLYGTKKFKSGAQLRHVARPNIGFSYAPDFINNEKYFGRVQTNEQGRIEPYSLITSGLALNSGPPITGGGSITFGLNNNIELKTKDKKESTLDSLVYKKVKIFENLGFNTSYNLKADSLNLAPFVLAGNTRLFDKFSVNVGATMNPYSVNKATGNRVDNFYWSENKGLLDLTRASFRFSGSLKGKPNENGQDLAQAQLIPNPLYPGEQIFVDNFMNSYVDFSNPWNLSFNYNLSYNKSYSPNNVTNVNRTNTIRGNFNFNLTDNWKVNGSSGYDFEGKKFNYPIFNVRRDLHCWQMSFNWAVRNGGSSYFFTISPKSTMLQDLKLEKRRTVYDNFSN